MTGKKRPTARRRRVSPVLPRKDAKKPRKTSRKTTRNEKLSAYIAFGVLAVIFLNVCCYLWMNQKVTRYLTAPKLNSETEIYFRPYKLNSSSIKDLDQIENYLQSLNYHLTQEKPKAPREYQRGKEHLTVLLHAFTGESEKYSEALYKFSAGKILDKKGKERTTVFLPPRLLKQIGGEQRQRSYTPLNKIPKVVTRTVLASEDHRFYKHFGIDVLGILRAVFVNLASLRFSQGGSTITQQLVKNTLLYPRKTLIRKYLEMLAAISLESKLSKDKILELYLNEVYLGQEGATAIHGFNAASQTFFHKNVEELTQPEAALLAGIIKAPSHYSPRRNLSRALTQRDLVLGKLKALNWIDEKTYSSAIKSKTGIYAPKNNTQQQNYFIEYLQRELKNYEQIPESKLLISSGLDYQIQTCGTQALSKGLEQLREKHPRLKSIGNDLQGSLIAIEPVSGMIRAWVGGSDFGKSQFDRVWQSKRQIGSLAKPFVYLTALDAKLNNYRPATADSILVDDQVRIELSGRKIWQPQNYDQQYRGQVTLRYALENSLNVPAVFISQRLGLDAVGRTFKNFRLTDSADILPSSVLGSIETNLLTITNAYAALANGGRIIEPRAFSRVHDSKESEVLRSEFSEETLADEAATFILTNILQGVIERGTGRSARAAGFSLPVAGKTGTTNEMRDAWFVGYTPALTAGVWVGRDSNKPLGLTGGASAAIIWGEFMHCIQANDPLLVGSEFIAPRNVQSRLVDSQSGELASPSCPKEQVVQEIYVSGTEPRSLCPLHN